MKIFLARFAIKSRVVRYIKKNQMIMRQLLNIGIFLILLFVFFGAGVPQAATKKYDSSECISIIDSLNRVATLYQNDTIDSAYVLSFKSDGIDSVAVVWAGAPVNSALIIDTLHLKIQHIFISDGMKVKTGNCEGDGIVVLHLPEGTTPRDPGLYYENRKMDYVHPLNHYVPIYPTGGKIY